MPCNTSNAGANFRDVSLDCRTVHCSRCVGQGTRGDLLGKLVPKVATSLYAGAVVIRGMFCSVLSTSAAIVTVFLLLLVLTSYQSTCSRVVSQVSTESVAILSADVVSHLFGVYVNEPRPCWVCSLACRTGCRSVLLGDRTEC